MITTTAANAVLNLLLGGTNINVPTSYYVGLSTTALTSNGTGATEPVGNGYARVSMANNKSNFSSATVATLTNLSQIAFPEATPAGWGTISYVFLADASTGGVVWYYEALTTTRLIQANATFIFVAGSLTFKMINT